jgi:hypothetical protein
MPHEDRFKHAVVATLAKRGARATIRVIEGIVSGKITY